MSVATPSLQRRPVGLGPRHQVRRQLGGLPQAQGQKPGGEGVQGPQVADLPFLKDPPDPAHHVEGAEAFGFID